MTRLKNNLIVTKRKRLYERKLWFTSLLFQTAELPHDLRSRLMLGPLQFVPRYIYVEEEWNKSSSTDDKVTELLNKYTRENGK